MVHGSSAGWVDWDTGILLVFHSVFCILLLVYIYIPRPFYTYFLLDGTVRRMEGRCI